MKNLRYTQRQAIARGIRAGRSNAQIARQIGVHRATVGREITRNAESREAYAARQADDLSWQRKQDAVPRHRPMQYGGVKHFQRLGRPGRFYAYISKLHFGYSHNPASNLPAAWSPAYVRLHEKIRFTPDSFYKRFRMPLPFRNLSERKNLAAFRLPHPLKESLAQLHRGQFSW